MSPIVIGITGASGAAYAVRVIELLAAADVEIHLAISALGRRLLADELDIKRIDADQMTKGRGHLLIVHHDNDLGAAIASGSWPSLSSAKARLLKTVARSGFRRAAALKATTASAKLPRFVKAMPRLFCASP